VRGALWAATSAIDSPVCRSSFLDAFQMDARDLVLKGSSQRLAKTRFQHLLGKRLMLHRIGH
jgi:hypothetical protein